MSESLASDESRFQHLLLYYELIRRILIIVVKFSLKKGSLVLRR